MSRTGVRRPLALVCRTLGLARSSAYAKAHGRAQAIAPTRREEGLAVSRKRVLRLMRLHGLLAPTRRVWEHTSGAHTGSIVPDAPNELWGTDATRVETTEEGWAWVFVAIDHHSLEPWADVAKKGDRFAALEPVREAVRERFGAVTPGVARGPALRHDHGSQYVSHHFTGELHWLGIAVLAGLRPGA